MAEASKAGVAGGGLLLATGLGFASFGDDCARAGMRGAGAIDDVAGGAAGARMASWGPDKLAGAGLDDAARLGVGADDATRAGIRVDGVALPGLRGAGLQDGLAGARAGEGPWFEEVRKFGVEVGIELVSTDMDGELPAVVATPGQVRCPRRLEVTGTPAEWDELLGGFGVACAPVVVVGTASADGKALRVGAEHVSLVDLARACADVGARCVLVGCPALRAAACVAGSEDSFRDNPLQSSLPAYVRGFVAQAFSQEVAPVVIAALAVVEGEAKLVIARPGADRR
jgi:hypothetical protein